MYIEKKVRSPVEWVFNDITSYFASLEIKKNLKIGLRPIGTMYSACGLLRNALTCFYGSSTSTFRFAATYYPGILSVLSIRN